MEDYMEIKRYPANVPSDETVDLSSIRSLFAVRERLKADLAETKTKLEETEAMIKAKLGNAGTGLVDGRPALTRTIVESSSFDKKGLAAEHPDLVERFTRKTEYPRYTFKDMS